MDLTEKMKKVLSLYAKAIKDPADRRKAKAFVAMIKQRRLGEDFEAKVLKNPDLGESERLHHRRRQGRQILVGIAKKKGRSGLANRVTLHHEGRVGKKRNRS
jgi:hypothetical protein